jgi:hypothetical protein
LINPLHHAPWLQKMEPALYGQEDVFDAVMFLLRCKRGHYFFATTDDAIRAVQHRDSLLLQWHMLTQTNRYLMMNVSSSNELEWNQPNLRE